MLSVGMYMTNYCQKGHFIPDIRNQIENQTTNMNPPLHLNLTCHVTPTCELYISVETVIRLVIRPECGYDVFGGMPEEVWHTLPCY